MYRNNIMGTLKINLYHSLIGQVLRLPGVVSLDVLRNASLQIKLTVSEVVDTDNRVTSSPPFLIDPSSIIK